MQDELFFNTGFSPIGILDKLYQESKVEENYYLSPAEIPVMRCDVSEEIRRYFEKLIAVPFNDCGFLKTYPDSAYPLHKDGFRITALNMTMMDFDPDFSTQIMAVRDKKLHRYSVNYVRDQFTILNVAELHAVVNTSKTLTRTILSMGFRNHDYQTLMSLHREGKLFNAI